MTVDGQESPMVTTVGDATTLDVEGKLYLGGLPSEYRARNIGNVSSVFSVGLFLPLLWWLFVLWTPQERLPELPIIPHEQHHTGAAAREYPRDAPVLTR